MIQPRLLLAAGLVLLGVATRVAPYAFSLLGWADVSDPNGMPWNVPPIAAICLFGGTCFANRRWSYSVPLIAMLLGDLGIGLLMGPGWGLNPLSPVVYGSYALMVWAGTWLRNHVQQLPSLLTRVIAIGGTALVAESLFFLTTNFANWVFQPGLAPGAELMYPHNAAGLIACYVAAIPFFGKSLTGTVVYVSVLFGAHELYGSFAKRVDTTRPSVMAESR